MPSKTGIAEARLASLPPHMKERVPFLAPRIPPDIGVSMKTIPAFSAISANSIEALGRMVEASRN